MPEKFKAPKISDKLADELAQACRFAYGNEAADDFFDKIMAGARKLRQRRDEREAWGEQTRAE
jgi:hypothetical protein